VLTPIDVHQRISPILDEIQALLEELEKDQVSDPSDTRQLMIDDIKQADSVLTGLYLTT
jgi:hypothetical protein